MYYVVRIPKLSKNNKQKRRKNKRSFLSKKQTTNKDLSPLTQMTFSKPYSLKINNEQTKNDRISEIKVNNIKKVRLNVLKN